MGDELRVFCQECGTPNNEIKCRECGAWIAMPSSSSEHSSTESSTESSADSSSEEEVIFFSSKRGMKLPPPSPRLSPRAGLTLGASRSRVPRVALPLVVVVFCSAQHLASRLVEALLEGGEFRVRGVCEEASNLARVGHLLALPGARERLTLEEELRVQGARYVVHAGGAAFPGGRLSARQDAELLRDAKKFNVRRVVLASSSSSVLEAPVEGYSFDEKDWNESGKGISARRKEAEEAAIRYAVDSGLDLVVVNLFELLGPSMTHEALESRVPVMDALQGRVSLRSDPFYGVVDVRDAAAALLRAMVSPKARGQRYLCCGHVASKSTICNTLAYLLPAYEELLPDAAKMSRVGPELLVDTSKIVRDLEVQFRPLAATLSDMAHSLIWWNHVEELRASRLSPMALALISEEMTAHFGTSAYVTGESVLEWLQERQEYQSESKTLRDAEALVAMGTLAPRKQKAGSSMAANDSLWEVMERVEQPSSELPAGQVMAAVTQLDEVHVGEEYNALIKSAIHALHDLAAGGIAQGWSKIGTKDGVHMMKKQLEGSPLYTFKGVGRIARSTASVAQLVGAQEQLEWNPMLKEIRVLQEYAGGLRLLMYAYQADKCGVVSVRRHFVFLQCKNVFPDGTIVVVSRSVSDLDVPPPFPGSVLGAIHPSGWIIKEASEGACDVTYVASFDPRGLPPFAINTAGKEQPLLISHLRRYMTGKKS